MPSGNLKQRFPLQSRLQANQSKKHPEKKRSVPLPGRSLFLQNFLFLYNANSTADPRQSPAAKWQTNFHRWQNWTSKPKRKKAAISQAESKTLKIQRIMSYAMPLDTSSRSDTSAFSPLPAQLFPFKSTKRIRILWVQDSPP